MRQSLPDVLYVCDRCKRGIVVFLGTGDSSVYEPHKNRPDAYCYVCNNNEPGVRYTRIQEDDGR